MRIYTNELLPVPTAIIVSKDENVKKKREITNLNRRARKLGCPRMQPIHHILAETIALNYHSAVQALFLLDDDQILHQFPISMREFLCSAFALRKLTLGSFSGRRFKDAGCL